MSPTDFTSLYEHAICGIALRGIGIVFVSDNYGSMDCVIFKRMNGNFSKDIMKAAPGAAKPIYDNAKINVHYN